MLRQGIKQCKISEKGGAKAFGLHFPASYIDFALFYALDYHDRLGKRPCLALNSVCNTPPNPLGQGHCGPKGVQKTLFLG